MIKKILLLHLALLMYFVQAQNKKNNEIHNSPFLDSLLNSKPELKTFLQKKVENNIQIVYTKIDRDTNNNANFSNYYYNLNHQQYFYPASTVKMPLAFLSLEKLNDLNKLGLNSYSIMITDSSKPKQQIVFNDPTSENGCPSIAHYIKKIFLVSDNDAYNRLYEFLGQANIQKKLKKKGFDDVAIRHRFFTALNEEDNKNTNPMLFYDSLGSLLYKQNDQHSKANYNEPNVLLGNAHYSGSNLIQQPFNFTKKNRIYLDDLHEILKRVIFPENFPDSQKFNLKPNDYQFLLKWMSAYPKESSYPYYDSVYYYDAYCKYLLFGSQKENLPANIRIFNKVGLAYGFLTDIAYIIDTENKVEFMLSATISCNSDGVYNDDKYDYTTIGFPFLKLLGQTIYQYELKRERTVQPNLTKFIFDYKN